MNIASRLLTFLLLGVICSASEDEINEFVVKIKESSTKSVQAISHEIADKFNLDVVRVISEEHMPEYVVLQRKDNLLPDVILENHLESEKEVLWAKKQTVNKMELKGTDDAADIRNMITKNKYLNIPECHCHNVKASSDKSLPSYVFNAQNMKKSWSYTKKFNDYRWPCQWELYNCGQSYGPGGYDMNIAGVWDKGYTGKGLVVAIVDSGTDFHQIDMKKNYLPAASIDLTEYPDLDGPLPKIENSHGTECAGIIAMEANNGYCGVGVAHGAKYGAIRMMGNGHTTDAREAAALIYKANLIDVSSNSWGPADDGYIYGGPKYLGRIALERASKQGRSGKGVIYAHASGNGGDKRIDDSCGADGFTCSIYTVSVTSISHNGRSVFFTEPCSCVMVGVPQTDPYTSPTGDANIYGEYTHDLVAPHNTKGCSMKFSGTSAATPMVAGGLALVLDANPNLTWRDIQYLIANTSRVTDPTDNGWKVNAAGYHVHNKMGFGSLDVLKMVSYAKHWTNVDKQQNCTLHFKNAITTIPSNGHLDLVANTNGCQGTDNQVLQLEHVQAILSYKVECRGDLKIQLRSPCGTWSTLMTPRKKDFYTTLIEWPYMSVHNWGEDPRGQWILRITDVKGHAPVCLRSNHESSAGLVLGYTLKLYGLKAQHRRSHVGCVGRTQKLNSLKSKAKTIGKVSGKFISSLTQKNLIQSFLDYTFIEDFRTANVEDEMKKLSIRDPKRIVKKPLKSSIAAQSKIMALWKSEFNDDNAMAKSLVDFAVNRNYPTTISKEEFKVVRCVVTKDLIHNPMTSHPHEDMELDEDGALSVDKILADVLLFGLKEKHRHVMPDKDEFVKVLSHVLSGRKFNQTCSQSALVALQE